MKEIKEVLLSLGLSNTEISVYLSLLRLGRNTASIIAKRTDLNRSTTRYTLDQLVKKRLAIVEQKNNIFYFLPEPPKKIITFLEEERIKLQEKENQVDRIIGELEGIMNPHIALPKVQFFEGKEGLTRLYDSILEQKSPIDSFEDKGEMVKFIPEYVEKFIQKRKEEQIFNRVICPGSNTVNKISAAEFRETKIIQESEFPFTCDIKICGDLVSIFSFNDQNAVGVGIRHQEIADNFRMMFNLLWGKLDK